MELKRTTHPTFEKALSLNVQSFAESRRRINQVQGKAGCCLEAADVITIVRVVIFVTPTRILLSFVVLLNRGLFAVFVKQGESYSPLCRVEDNSIAVDTVYVHVPITQTDSPLRLYLVIDEACNLIVYISAPV